MLKMIRYYTANSWNKSTAPAFNLKVYNVIPCDLRNKVYDSMECENFYDEINFLMKKFDQANNYQWQAGFNGRSRGYLVLYKGGRKKSDHKSYCTLCGQRNFKTIEESDEICGKCMNRTRINKEFYEAFSYPGKNIDNEEVPEEVLKDFQRLAEEIVDYTINLAKEGRIKEEEYTVKKTRQIVEV